mmetsp:Transcript_22626/g.73849  ORF Transcript_22626/g.73849 Transcript_22626/m.73849 type:complete len:204 (+) Transcript_22626:425-1036(+)
MGRRPAAAERRAPLARLRLAPALVAPAARAARAAKAAPPRGRRGRVAAGRRPSRAPRLSRPVRAGVGLRGRTPRLRLPGGRARARLLPRRPYRARPLRGADGARAFDGHARRRPGHAARAGEPRGGGARPRRPDGSGHRLRRPRFCRPPRWPRGARRRRAKWRRPKRRRAKRRRSKRRRPKRRACRPVGPADGGGGAARAARV